MSSRRGSLQPAHRGYQYQDIATAYELVLALVERYESVIVDRKQVLDDRIDDLEIVTASRRRIRRQFKSSGDPGRRLAVSDFTGIRSSLRIGRLVLTHARLGAAPADEYRLCATWQFPDDELADLLEPLAASPTIAGWASELYRIPGERLWPAGDQLIWSSLLPHIADPDFSREQVLAFCERFVIELGLPIASERLAQPGPLEQALVDELAVRVGIGRYPNDGRTATDVAALAISLATHARSQEASLTPAEVEHELDIRTDFGRVAQAFPVDNALFHDRPTFRRTLATAVKSGHHQLVVAPPGAGKSWELTRLAEELRADGAIVARHYCYLEPGDALVERRVTIDVFFANLLAELVDADSELRGAGESRYAAGLRELEATLAQAVTLGRPVVLIVDGLDHISRVRSDAGSLREDDTDIVEQLATLDIPNGVSLVVGSQPGIHLDPLRIRWGPLLLERAVAPWTAQDVMALAHLYSVPRALGAVGIVETSAIVDVLHAFAERADGNPLYARYLARGLVSGLGDGHIANPVEWIAAAPAIGGDVAVYYMYLYRAASAGGQAVADVLGSIDFAVTEGDLREILVGPLAAWVPHALTHLAAVLTTTTGQGGVRVFHESFRRFMAEELSRRGRSTAAALEPVITWLEKRGFYRDAKSYRFLLPALKRAGRDAEILALVETTFVSDSVAYGHPLNAIQRNLALATDVAALRLDWPALVRCVELHRAAYTCFDVNQNTWDEYWPTYCDLFGASALAERLLFDGRPTQTRSHGLLACTLLDDAGGIAPWREYLALTDDAEAEGAARLDVDGALTEGERVTLAAVHGRLRLGQQMRVMRGVLIYLQGCGDDFRPAFIRVLAARLARSSRPEFVERLALRADPGHRGAVRITRRAASVLLLGLADYYMGSGDVDAAAATASQAVKAADTAELALACLRLGASPSYITVKAQEPSEIAIGLVPGEFLHDAQGVRLWVACIRLHADDPQRGTATLEAEGQRVGGVGWYRCWLRFVLRLAAADAARSSPGAAPHGAHPADDVDVAAAFDELTQDAHPFRGTPRPCDLYSIRLVIQETLARGLALLRSESGWRRVLEALVLASHGTASRLDREDGGPLPTLTLLDLLLPYAGDSVGGSLVRGVIEREVARRDLVGTYYPTHAEYAMRLARARLKGEDRAGARSAWTKAAVFFAAYGWHKDVTVYDVVESAPALAGGDPVATLKALATAQPLAQAVIAHSDHRETSHAPNAWFKSLLAVKVASGIALLAETVSEEQGTGGWVIAQALRDAARAATDLGDPALVDAALGTVLLEVEHDSEAAKRVDERLAPIIRLAQTDPALAEQCLRQLAAAVMGDVRRHATAAATRVEEVAAALNVSLPRLALVPAASASGSSAPEIPWRHPLRESPLISVRRPPFPPTPSVVDLLVGLRAVGDMEGRTRSGWGDVVLALSYHLGQLVDAGREDDARRVLRFWARDTYVLPTGAPHPLGSLAEALENAGYLSLAKTAYALAYTATRGGMGYGRLGDRSHSWLLARALAFDGPGARRLVAEEVAYAFRGSWYSIGTSRHLIERIAEWGEPEVAAAAWREAAAVVAHRLPLPPVASWFAPLIPDEVPAWTVDEGLVALMLGRLSEPRLALKVAALTGVVRAIQRRPDCLVVPLRWWLTRNASVTSVLLVLHALWRAEGAPFAITQGIDDILAEYVGSTIWGARLFAGWLLTRANLTVPTPNAGVSKCAASGGAGHDRVIDADRLAVLLSSDIGDRTIKLKPLWPELPELVAQRLDTVLRDDEGKTQQGHRDQIEARYRLEYGDDGKSRPATPVLQWYVELFEAVLQEQLLGLKEQLWKAGRWEPELESRVLATIVPNTALHLGLAASRAVRPASADPAMLADGLGPPTRIDDDPEYLGWVRLGIVERHYVCPADRSWVPPTEVVTFLAGAVGVPLGETIPPGTFPFSNADAGDWWRSDPGPALVAPRLPLEPIAGWRESRTGWVTRSYLSRRSGYGATCHSNRPPTVDPSYG